MKLMSEENLLRFFSYLQVQNIKYFVQEKPNPHLIINLQTPNDKIDFIKIVDHSCKKNGIRKSVLKKSVEIKGCKKRLNHQRVNLRTFESGHLIILWETTPHLTKLVSLMRNLYVVSSYVREHSTSYTLTKLDRKFAKNNYHGVSLRGF